MFLSENKMNEIQIKILVELYKNTIERFHNYPENLYTLTDAIEHEVDISWNQIMSNVDGHYDDIEVIKDYLLNDNN